MAGATLSFAGPGEGGLAGRRHEGLQALRGIAALLVFVQHIFVYANLVVPGPVDALYRYSLGGIGVFIFFGLSAHLITSKAGDPAGKFLTDRIRRIFPALWVILLIGGLTNKLLIGSYGLTWQVFLLLPIGNMPTVLIPYWTLYYEVLLYAIIFVVARFSPRAVSPVILAWAAIAWVFQDRPYGNGHYLFPGLYHLAFPIFGLYFAAGILSAVRFGSAAALRPVYAVLALIMFLSPHYVSIPWIYRLVPTFIGADIVFLLFGFGTFFALRAALLWHPTGLVGRILLACGNTSYGLYLSHMVIMYVGVHVMKTYGAPDTYLEVALILTVWALPVAMLFGAFDFRLQDFLKARLGRARRMPAERLAVPAQG